MENTLIIETNKYKATVIGDVNQNIIPFDDLKNNESVVLAIKRAIEWEHRNNPGESDKFSHMVQGSLFSTELWIDKSVKYF